MDDARKHPSRYSSGELLSMCQVERLALEQRALVPKRQLRERAAELTTGEQRLDTIHSYEAFLLNEQSGQPVELRAVK